jgi:hypothetical protein
VTLNYRLQTNLLHFKENIILTSKCGVSDSPKHGCTIHCVYKLDCQSQSQSYVTTDGQPASLSWNKAPIWGLRPDLDYCLTVAGLLIWGALSDERTGLSFAIATGPRQCSLKVELS